MVSLALIAVLPAVIASSASARRRRRLVSLARWPLLALVALGTLAVLYRYGPNRDAPQWRWVSWGAVLATVVWILASIAFSIYVSSFGSYNQTYGSLGAVIILLTWMWVSAFIVLMGAELQCRDRAPDPPRHHRRREPSRWARVAPTPRIPWAGGDER